MQCVDLCRARLLRAALFAALAVGASTASGGGGRGPAPGRPVVTAPEAGVLLLARRGMSDPRFRKSVILLTTHDEDGSLGLIINRASATPLTSVLPEVGAVTDREYPVYFGGPVGLDRILFLVRHDGELPRAVAVLDGLHFSGDRSTLEQMLVLGKRNDELRVYLGYAGWGPGQLAGELSDGDWIVVPATRESVFSDTPGDLWDRLMDRHFPRGELVRNPLPAATFAG